ncbi:hypothetical protein CMEL01_12400 [Colletotrichum melonis]|uniref:Uncharacterized protein n=1 Tax=Colletotrichum melonis TaxID=1209925 RepID=A0AAI9XVZ7_9PEZI|nr:hypothetical protein CMEL01_12400 [Colletotrichum melonis]
MGNPSLAQSYRSAMRRHRFGYGLYEPAPFSRLRPGMLGYLDDEYQRWHPILDLADAEAVKAAGLAPLGYLQRSPPDPRRYGPLKADKVTETSVELEAGVGGAAVGLPVEVAGVFKYSTAGSFGAVLLCGDEIMSEGFDFRDPFLAWLQIHAKVLFANSKGSATVGCDVGAADVAKVGPKVSWVRGASSSGWSTWKDQKRVVFFAGVKIKTGFFGSLREESEKNWRGGDEAFIVDDDENGTYTVSVEQFGDDWHRIRRAGEGGHIAPQDSDEEK